MPSSQVEVENKLDTFNYMTVKSLDCEAKLNIYCIGTTADEGVVQIQVIDDADYDDASLFYTELSIEDTVRVRTFLIDTLPPKPSELLSIIVKSLKFKILNIIWSYYA